MTSRGGVVAVVQARMGSTRLPGKVLMPLAGEPMVTHVLHRAQAISGVDTVVAALPDLPEDDVLAATCQRAGALVIRGSADDVLTRYSKASQATDAEVVVRLTADCPFLSPATSAHVLSRLGNYDYASNTLERTFPRGLDTEVFTRRALDTANREASDPTDREHVTPFIYRRPHRFALMSVRDDYDRSDHRWTVDTADDMAFAVAVYDSLGPQFEMEEVFALLLRRPELRALNSSSQQKELR